MDLTKRNSHYQETPTVGHLLTCVLFYDVNALFLCSGGMGRVQIPHLKNLGFLFWVVTCLLCFGNIALEPLREKFIRPRLKVHGCWAFGYCVQIYAIDDPGRHNSSCIIEILAKTLQEVTGLKPFLWHK